ncbi:TetR family transcriptional regulator [Paenibacillus sp. HJL G12]|uniref:TetR family transcriptional regulator n=1 Tax=Paenibacillus dendrobii TaxID=2691084 RepID=A0A7X3LIK8_9BACL|nr:TetR/AcrR family transcriptional regulator [Paenibacillus dendrobii]MWV46252.1 TetR family transcriptional regulator [Paenibacillus dendrobii]
MAEQSKDRKGNTEGEQHTTKSRRRGDVLENAILSAAWEELRETGYSRLTMEAVAARAKTNKNAVYRRWPSKAKLVVASLMKHTPKPSLEAPDTGNLREDVLTLLERIIKPIQMIGAETIHGLMGEFHGDEIHSKMTLPPRSEDILAIAMKSILLNAERRGEVKLEELPDRVITLPVDLIRFELLTTHTPLTDEAVVEIVDAIFLPLVQKPNRQG